MTMPGFVGGASLYQSAGRYRASASPSADVDAIMSAQLLQQLPTGPTGPKGCTVNPVDTSICATGCQRVCIFGTEVTETCVAASQCSPVTCGPCALTIPQTVVSQLLSGQPIDTSQLVFTQSCHQGPGTFTQPCTKCSPETRISLPFPISDRCIQVCTGGLDPSSISVSVREC